MFSSKIILILWIASTAYSASLVVNPDKEGEVEDEVDNSPFDQILAINQNAAKHSRAGSPNYFEGDIVITDAVQALKKQNLARGGGIHDTNRLWPVVNGKRLIPYAIDNAVYAYRGMIEKAMKEWMEKVTCLQFSRTRGGERAYLYFTGGRGCSSPVGYRGARNTITLANGCMAHGIIVHEIGHSLGFWHEQSRPDRDQHIQILTRNIQQNMAYNFDVQRGITTGGFPYDTSSIMHYGTHAFSANGLPTIRKLRSSDPPIGQRNGLSRGDVNQAIAMYCRGSTSGSVCTDMDSSCPGYASSGYCHGRYEQWMGQNCKKSCKLC